MAVIAYFLGALPFSVWLTRLFLKKDVRRYGDGNPGSFNTFLAGSNLLGVLVMVLDISKAAVPVGLAYQSLSIRGLPMILIAVMPILGHAFSPFLVFKGGKAIGTALGTVIGISLWQLSLPAVLGAGIGIAFLTSTGWAIILAEIAILVAIAFWFHDPHYSWIMLCIIFILGWILRGDLKKPPQFRPWVIRAFSRLDKQ